VVLRETFFLGRPVANLEFGGNVISGAKVDLVGCLTAGMLNVAWSYVSIHQTAINRFTLPKLSSICRYSHWWRKDRHHASIIELLKATLTSARIRLSTPVSTSSSTCPLTFSTPESATTVGTQPISLPASTAAP